MARHYGGRSDARHDGVRPATIPENSDAHDGGCSDSNHDDGGHSAFDGGEPYPMPSGIAQFELGSADDSHLRLRVHPCRKVIIICIVILVSTLLVYVGDRAVTQREGDSGASSGKKRYVVPVTPKAADPTARQAPRRLQKAPPSAGFLGSG